MNITAVSRNGSFCEIFASESEVTETRNRKLAGFTADSCADDTGRSVKGLVRQFLVDF